jgi:hypothetical protein
MDRCHSFWVQKQGLEGKGDARSSGTAGKEGLQLEGTRRKGLFIAAGATAGKKLFDGALLTVRYFFDAIDTDRWRSLLYRGVDEEGEILKHPEYLREACEAGRDLVRAIEEEPD